MSGNKKDSHSHSQSESSTASQSKEEKKEEQETMPPFARVLLTFSLLLLLVLISGSIVYYMVWSKTFILHKFVSGYKNPEKVVYATLGYAFLLIILTHLPALAARAIKNPKGVNNKAPRKDAADLKGWGYRAWASHSNMLEAFPSFAAGILVALHAKASPLLIAKLGVLWLFVRIAYTFAYLFNLDYLRTTVWLMGWIICASLFLLPFYSNLYKNSPEEIFEGVQTIFNSFF